MELCSMLYGSLDGRGVWGQNVLCLVTQSCPTLCYPNDCSPPGSSVHRDSPSKNTGVGCHALLQGIVPSQGSNPGLPHSRRILYHLSHQGSHWRRMDTCICVGEPLHCSPETITILLVGYTLIQNASQKKKIDKINPAHYLLWFVNNALLEHTKCCLSVVYMQSTS